MIYKNFKGKELNVSSNLIETNKTVLIVEKIDDYYIIEDFNKLRAKIHESIIQDNNISIIDNKIELTDSIYTNYFAPVIRELESKSRDLLKENFELIYNNREYIINHPEYYLIRTSLFYAIIGFVRPTSFCLGELLEAWEYTNELDYTDPNNIKMKLIYLSKSCFNSLYYSVFWAPEEKMLITKKSSDLKKDEKGINDLDYYSALRKIKRIKDIPLNVNYLSLQKLIKELKDKNDII